MLQQQLGPTKYTYRNNSWIGDVAFLEWSADTPKAMVDDGADSFVIRDGRIVGITAYYTVQARSDRESAPERRCR